MLSSRERHVGVFGDYDVDGAAAAALLVNILGALGLAVDVHILDRMKEGYGPNEEALSALRARGAGLIVTVDCGIAAHGRWRRWPIPGSMSL